MHPADAAAAPEEGPTGRDARRKRERAVQVATQAATLPVAAGVKATTGAGRLLEMLDLDRPGSMVAKIADQGVGVADTLDKLLVGQPADVAVFGKTGVAKRADWAPAHDLAAGQARREVPRRDRQRPHARRHRRWASGATSRGVGSPSRTS